MKLITIGGKDYKFEFSVEASLYNNITEKVASLFFGIIAAEGREDLHGLISSISDMPNTVLTMFYAGLLEHHGEFGDGSVNSIIDAKILVKKYFSEDKERSFYSLMHEMIDCMNDDGFFKQIGLDKMLESETEEEQEEQEVPKEPKKPQDHKKKTTAKPKPTEK